MGRPINAQRFLGATAPHQIQATVYGPADSGSTAGYLTKQNSPHRFRAATVNGSSLTTFVNGSGNLVVGTSYVAVFPVGTIPTTPATGSAKLKGISATTIISGGTGYAALDYLTLVGGTFTSAVNVQVLTVNGANAVLTVSAPVAGTQGYTVLPANVAAIATTTNSANGAGAVIGFNFGVESATVATGGAGYTDATFIVNGAKTAPTFTEPTVVSGAVSTGAVVVLTAGIVNVNPTVTIEGNSGTATEYVKTITSANYLNTYQGNQYRWLYKEQAIPSDYNSLAVKLAYLDTL
jgi:hypothetical protein